MSVAPGVWALGVPANKSKTCLGRGAGIDLSPFLFWNHDPDLQSAPTTWAPNLCERFGVYALNLGKPY